MATIFLSVILPGRTFASSSTVVATLSSYAPYVIGGITGITVAFGFGELVPFSYESLTNPWKWTIVFGAPAVWLFIGVLANHLAAVVEGRREHDKGMDELREYRHRIMMVHEQTRKDIAGLLHGRVQSRMVVLGQWLKDCRDQLKEGPAKVVEGLENSSKLLQEIRDQELRSITRQLYPSIIHAGLPSALSSLADRFNTVFDVTLEIDKSIAELESPKKPSLDESLRVGLYRVAEEALSNVAKHSQTRKAPVSLSLSSAREVLLVIRDDGQGFEPAGVPSGQGLLSMEDYVTALGGTLELSNSLGMGTTVKASVPVSCRRSSPEIPYLGQSADADLR